MPGISILSVKHVMHHALDFTKEVLAVTVKGRNSSLKGNDNDRGKGIQSSKVEESEIQKVSFVFALVRGPCQMCNSWGKHAPGPRRQCPSTGRGQSSNRWIEETGDPHPINQPSKSKAVNQIATDRCSARNPSFNWRRSRHA